tara:strand:+ start:276 stop:521 length:246 start_codon:yes stop_codon:yes gene_type:complete
MAKQRLNEVLGLDKIMKYALVGFFGPKVMDKAFKAKVLRDPEVKKKVNDLNKDLQDLRNKIASMSDKNKDIIDKAIAKNLK